MTFSFLLSHKVDTKLVSIISLTFWIVLLLKHVFHEFSVGSRRKKGVVGKYSNPSFLYNVLHAYCLVLYSLIVLSFTKTQYS